MIFSILWIFLSFFTVIHTFEEDECGILTDHEGDIISSDPNYSCWYVKVPEGKYIRLFLDELTILNMELEAKVKVVGEDKSYVFHKNDVGKHFSELNDIQIMIKTMIPSYYYGPHPSHTFKLYYSIEDIICARDNSFRCSAHSCVHQSKKCDSVLDCDGGEDESGCDTGIKSMDGVNESRLAAISWLKTERSAFRIWRKNGHRAITAMYLSDGVDTKASCDENQIYEKEMQLKTSVILLRNGTDPVSTNDLAMFIHGLLVTCQNPRRFYGFDLVRSLKEKVRESDEGTHPFAILALCNANETLTDHQVKKLQQILQSDSSHAFLLDIQAMALMALSCIRNSGKVHSSVKEDINSTINRFRQLQKIDGSFGNIYTSALVIQALLGSAEEKIPQPRMKDAVNYLLKQQSADKSFGDFLATYLVLPILNSKSLVDIASLDCPPRKPGNDSVSEIENRFGPKMYTEYSLYIGDDLDVVHSISLRVTQNLTAFEIMELAAAADPKYKFESHKDDKNVYVFSIAGITNDVEAGKFWQLYLEQNEKNGTTELVIESPDQKIIQEHDRMIMWYKTADV